MAISRELMAISRELMAIRRELIFRGLYIRELQAGIERIEWNLKSKNEVFLLGSRVTQSTFCEGQRGQRSMLVSRLSISEHHA